VSSYLEHLNVPVRDIDETARFLITAMPEFRVRHRGVANGSEWAHVGTDETYFALNAVDNAGATSGGGGVNHVGFVVDDIEAVRTRLRTAGYRGGYRSGEVVKHPHRLRAYYLDADGNEYEFIQYLTDNPEERNTYDD